MKICFVLVADNESVFADCACMAVLSLKWTNPSLPVEIVLDPESYSWLVERNHPLLRSNVGFLRVKTPYGRSALASRWLKTTLRQHISGKFLYLDLDVIVVRSLVGLELIQAPVSAALDRNYDQPYPHVPCHIKALFAAKNWDLPEHQYFNGGVLLVNEGQEANEFFKKWHENWLECVDCGIHTDQQSLNAAVIQCGGKVSVLSWRYNAMAGASPYFLIRPKIIHYYASQSLRSQVAMRLLCLAAGISGDSTKAIIELKKIIRIPESLILLADMRRLLTHIPERRAYSAIYAARSYVSSIRQRFHVKGMTE